jgi:hypothetical protein
MIDFQPFLRTYPYGIDRYGHLEMDDRYLHIAPMGWPQMKTVARWY